MATDMFLKIDGVKGEAQDSKHKEEIDVLAWSWGMSNSGSFHDGSGGGSGKADFQDISVTKYVDSASANLMKKCGTGEHYKEALLVVRKAGGKPLEYIKIKMEQVMVTSVSTGGSGGEDRLTENVTLNFAKFNYEYVPQKADGSGGGAIPYGYDIAANVEA
jgi:type VI secretion system secreted protein Hcp